SLAQELAGGSFRELPDAHETMGGIVFVTQPNRLAVTRIGAPDVERLSQGVGKGPGVARVDAFAEEDPTGDVELALYEPEGPRIAGRAHHPADVELARGLVDPLRVRGACILRRCHHPAQRVEVRERGRLAQFERRHRRGLFQGRLARVAAADTRSIPGR